jgi:hypothetical protein
MAIDKLIPRYLNKDDDARLVKTVEMTDALNVRISADADGNGGVIKNAYGNDDIPFRTGDELPNGDNEVIGVVSNPQDGEIYFFVWNENNDDSIYRFSSSSNEAQLVYRSSTLGFVRYATVRATVIKNLSDEVLLYFTDGINEPRKINATRALLGLYPAAFTSGTDSEKLICTAVAKQPPMTPPTFVFSTNPTLRQNNLYEATFQFAAQYVYQDGERSAISPYSELAVSPAQFFDGILSEEEKLKDNTLTISVPTSVADVKEIIVLARNGNIGTFYEIGTVNNSPTTAFQTITFDNSKLYTPVSGDEVKKIYDNVPFSAESLTIVGNRLVFGGYTAGRENIRTDVDVLPNYFPQPDNYDIEVSYPSEQGPPIYANRAKSFDIDITSIPNSITEDSILNIVFSLNLGRITFQVGGMYVQWVQKDKATQNEHDYAGLIETYSNVGNITGGLQVKASPFSVSKYINVPAGSTKTEIVNLIKTSISGNYNLVLDSDVTNFDYATKITKVQDLQGTTNDNKWMFFNGSGQMNVVLGDETSTYLTFEMKITTAALAAKVGYNFNVANTINTAVSAIPPLSMIKSLFTKGKSLGDAYPATNVLFNQIEFVDVPVVTYKGDGAQYNYFGRIRESGNQFIPGNEGNGDNPIPFTGKTSFLTTQEDLDAPISFQANILTRGDINGYQTFKAGATHSFGIVYYDLFNRNGGVQPLRDMYVDWYDVRSLDNDLYGRVDTVLRVKHNAPLWAVKWAPVYAKINSVTNKLQYSITRAYTATNLQAKPFSGVASFEEVIYLSMRSLEGKSDSYREMFAADIEYKFQEGDRLRIVQYGNLQRSSIDVEVLGYFDFIDDIDTNPVLDLTSDEDTFNTTGRFLAIRTVDFVGWDTYSIITGVDNWRNDCVIEIYRQNRPMSEQIFYEIGENYPVVNGIHVGQRTVVSPVDVEVAADGDGLIFYANVQVFKGDILTDGSGNTLVVNNVYPAVNGIYNYVFYANITSGSFSIATYTLNLTNSSDAVIQFSAGDSYYRPRLLKVGEKAYANNFEFSFIEDYSVSDMFPSNSVSIGRPHAVIPDSETTFYQSSIVYSEPYLITNQRLGLSSFNPSLVNFKDLDYRYGSIKQLVGDDDRMYVIQERKSGWVPVGRNVIQTSDGLESLTVSNAVFGVANYYLGDYGINNNPESLGLDRGRIYFADVRAGKIVRISRDGITLISEAKMDAFFKENFRYITTLTSRQKVVGGVDSEAEEYIVSTDLISSAVVTVTDGTTTYTYDVQTNPVGDRVVSDIEFDDDDIFTFSTEIREFQTICDEFQYSLNAIVFLDKLIDGQPAYVGEEFIGQTGVIYGVATNSTYDFFVTIALDLAQGNFSFTNDCGDYDGSIGSPSTFVNDFTAAFDVNDGVWNTLYSYRPEAIASVDDTLYTFKGGTMYVHTDAVPRTTYYGANTPAGSIVEVISSSNNSMVKCYEAMSIEGDAPWAVAVSNTDQSTQIASADFEEKERYYYAYVPRDSSANTGTSTITSLSGTSEVFVLGDVATGGVVGSSITFTAPVGAVAFPIGASLFKVSGNTMVTLSVTVTGITGSNTISCSGAPVSLANGNTVIAIANPLIEGDQMRDYFSKFRLSNLDPNEIELYAVNAVFSPSKLHNELGQQ